MFSQATEAPGITTRGLFMVAEGERAVAILRATDIDTTTADLNWTKAGGADADHFTLTNRGELFFAVAKDYEQPDDFDGDGHYELTVRVSDGDQADTADLVVTLRNVTETVDLIPLPAIVTPSGEGTEPVDTIVDTATAAISDEDTEPIPTISGPATVSFSENSWTRVATYSYSPSSVPVAGGIQWSLSGPDAAHLSIDSPAGALRFDMAPVSPGIFPEPPDFEDPVDSDRDNVYSVVLSVRAGASASPPLAVTVTVANEDEPGAIVLSDSRPRAGSALTATLTDPDGVTPGTVTWQWERSSGRHSWEGIEGATSASYTPVAADTNALLRVNATYDDEHGGGKVGKDVTSEVVTGPKLTGLQVSTGNAVTSSSSVSHGLRPWFSPDVLHYGIGCSKTDTMELSVDAPVSARVDVNGIQAGTGALSVEVVEESAVTIRVADDTGATTNYVVQCMPDILFQLETYQNPGEHGILDELLFLGLGGFLVVLDRNGAPRTILDPDGRPSWPRFQGPGEAHNYRYSYSLVNPAGRQFGAKVTVLDENLEILTSEVRVAPPLAHTAAHDFRVLPNGDYLLMSYQPTQRDLSVLSFTDYPSGSSVGVRDSAIQIITPAGQPVFNWNSWDHMALEDCVQHRFPPLRQGDAPPNGPSNYSGDYAHVNSLQYIGGQIVASFRGCSKVLGIDVQTGEVAWRLGRSNLSEEEWLARDVGPPPLRIVNDPLEGFCGQHTAQILPNGNLLLFDNGVVCVIRSPDPWRPSVARAMNTLGPWSMRWTWQTTRRCTFESTPWRGAKSYVGYVGGRSRRIWPTATG